MRCFCFVVRLCIGTKSAANIPSTAVKLTPAEVRGEGSPFGWRFRSSYLTNEMSFPQSDSSSGHDKVARRFLRQRHRELLDGLNLEEIKVQLYSDEVLDTQVQDKLMNPSFGARNKLQELLHYLTRQGEPGLLALIRALKKCADDPSQAKLGLDLEQQYHTFLSVNNSMGSTESSSIVSSNMSRRTSDLDEPDSAWPRAPIHVVSTFDYTWTNMLVYNRIYMR